MAGQANFMSAAGNVKYRRIMLSVAFGHLGVHSRPGTHMWLQVRRFLRYQLFWSHLYDRWRPQATRPANAAGFFAAWAWEGWGRVGVREGRSGEAMEGGKEMVKGRE